MYLLFNGTNLVQILEKGESWEFFFLYLLLKFYNFDSFFFAYFYDIIPLIFPPNHPILKTRNLTNSEFIMNQKETIKQKDMITSFLEEER